MVMSTKPKAAEANPGSDPRRGFLKKIAAVVIGGVVGLFPVLTGLIVFLDPLRRKGAASDFVRITGLEAVPDDGVPRLFQVLRDRTDPWNRFPNEPVGAVYLRNVSGTVSAFNAECPHAGCLVAFLTEQKQFKCPCHDSSCQADGERIDPLHCPSPRGLDPLSVEDRADGGAQAVWVKFEQYLAGASTRISRA
jgi:Rieske Fe-S protein